ncbi:MAG: hypothetical protein RIG77_07860 [Cyclobacteriaceae bacterium]
MRIVYSIIMLFALSSCTNSKSVVDNSTELNFNDISIGKSHSAVIGKTTSISQEEDIVKVSLVVEKMKQGGATAPVLSSNSQVEIVFTPIFLRNYQKLNGSSLISSLNKDERILVVVSRNLRDKQIQGVQLKTAK